MTGDVNLTHIREALSYLHEAADGWSDDNEYGRAAAAADLQLAAVEAVIQAAREAVGYLNAGEEDEACVILYHDLRQAVAALEDCQ